MSEHQTLLLILQLGALLVLAKVGGEIAVRLGQPAVIGQLLAGVLLGKSVLGAWWPAGWEALFPTDTGQTQLLAVVTWLGVLLLLFLVGLETDVELLRQQRRPALSVAVVGFLLPLALGIGWAFTVPGHLLPTSNRVLFALFIGVALSESSVPVVARILADMRLLRRSVGQTILAAALLQDTVGWIALAAIGAAATGERLDAAGALRPVAGVLLFAVFALTLGRRWSFALLRWVNDHVRGEQALLGSVLVLVLGGAAITESLGVHSILGAFLVGVMIAGSPVVGEKVVQPLEALTAGFLAPIFFAAAGAKVDLSGLLSAEMLPIAALLLLAACAGKILGGLIGGCWGGLPRWEALSVGMGINARGALGIVIAVLGLNLQVLTAPLFSALILTALVTTAMTPPLLGWALRRVEPRPEEQTRLDQEASQAGSFLGRVRRVLLATSGGPDALLSAQLIRAVGLHRPLELEVTVLNVAAPHDPPAVEALERVNAALRGGTVTVVERAGPADRTAAGIRRESERGYGLIVMGSGQAAASVDAVFGRGVGPSGPDVDSPLLIVRAPDGGAEWPPRRILVPTTGLLSSTAAAELAVAWARPAPAGITALHVIEAGAEMSVWLAKQERETEQLAREIASWVVALAEPFGVHVEAAVRHAPDAAPEIVRVARETGADLIVLSGTLRPTYRLFMGHTVDYVLKHAPCAVAVLRV